MPSHWRAMPNVFLFDNLDICTYTSIYTPMGGVGVVFLYVIEQEEFSYGNRSQANHRSK